LLDQPGRLPRTDHEPGVEFFVRFDRFRAVKTRIGPSVDLLHTRRQGLLDIPQMIADLRTAGPVAIAQFAPYVFSTLFTSEKGNKNRVLRGGAGQIFAFMSSMNGCKRLIAVAPQTGRRNSKRESSLWSGNWNARWPTTSDCGSNWKKP
jgi:hypothetical protein